MAYESDPLMAQKPAGETRLKAAMTVDSQRKTQVFEEVPAAEERDDLRAVDVALRVAQTRPDKQVVDGTV